MFVKRLKPISVLVVLALALMPVHGYCLPEGEQVVEGSATFDRSSANTLNINQATDKMIANYNSFSIAQPEAVNFMQPSSSSIALNRVVGVDPSLILGTLTANGRIFLINPNGVTFGQGCKVDTMGLVASTLNLANADFMAGRYSFVGNGGSVVNLGYLSAPGGYVALLGSRVENKGIIEAELGSVALASGKAVTLKLDPKGLISVVIDEATISNADNADDAVKNSGTIKVNGGKVFLTAQALDNVFKKAVNTDGIIEANSIGDVLGEVAVEANQRVAIGGTINAKGGVVRVNCQGAAYTGLIKAAQGIFNMNDGDTYISGDLTGGGEYSFSDNINIFVDGPTTLDANDLSITADADQNGVGNLEVTYDIEVTDGNIYMHGADINIKSSLVSATKTADVVSLVMDASHDVSITGSEVGTQIIGAGGQAYTTINAGNSITVEDDGEVASSISATVDGIGQAEVTFNAGRNGSDGKSRLELTNTEVTARVINDGGAHANIYNDNGNIDIAGSNILAEIQSGATTAEIDVWASDGDINIDDSGLTALVDDSGTAEIYLCPVNGGINISGGSDIIAQVNADGEAGVYMYNYDYDNVIDLPGIGEIDFGGAIDGDINITGTSEKNSTILAQASNAVDGETALVYMNTSGNINLASSDVMTSEAYGISAVAMIAGNDFNIDDNSSVSALSYGDIAAVLGLAGNNLNAFGAVDALSNEGVALVGLLAMNDVYAGSSTAKSFASGGPDGIDMVQDLINSYMWPDPTQSIIIERGDKCYSGFSLFGSLEGNIYLGDVTADAVAVAAFGLGGEGTGSIVDLGGTVTANYLGMLAACDIGTADEPIQTDVDIVSAYSYAKGDIYINQANSERMLELGMYLPITLYNLEEDGEGGSEMVPYEDPLGIGASVMAKDGIVHVTTEGDMTVNSVVALRGGVFLESKNGNIYAGRGWCPLISQNTIDSAAGIVGALVDFLFNNEDDEVTDTDAVVASAFEDFFNDASFLMIDFPLDTSANVWATGYSYFSTPNGSIGVGTPEDKDANMRGGIKGIVRPGVTQTVDGESVFPSLGFDLVPDSGYVMYQDSDGVCYGPLDGSIAVNGDPVQIWPEKAGAGLTFSNPLEVNIQLLEGSASAAPVRGKVYDQPFSPVAGLTLNYGTATLLPPTFLLDASSQLTGPLERNLRAYYEILSSHRFVSNEPMTPSTFFGYRPLTPTNMAAFDEMNLDIGAYDFISDNIKPKKPLSSYYGL